jgi:hypothetical protein
VTAGSLSFAIFSFFFFSWQLARVLPSGNLLAPVSQPKKVRKTVLEK